MAKKGLDVGKISTTAKEYSQVRVKCTKIDNFSFYMSYQNYPII